MEIMRNYQFSQTGSFLKDGLPEEYALSVKKIFDSEKTKDHRIRS